MTVGYTIGYGTTAGSYTTTRDIGLVTRYQLDGLTQGMTYCIAVRAYNASGQTSPYSNAVCGVAGGSVVSSSGGSTSGGSTSGGTTSGGSTSGGTTGGSTSGGSTTGSTSGSSTGTTSGTAARTPGSSTMSSVATGARTLVLTAAVRDNHLVDLSWTAASVANSYRIEIGREPGQVVLSGASRQTTATFDLGPIGAGTYYARVVAVTSTGFGDASNDAAVTIGTATAAAAGSSSCELPPAPKSLVATLSGALAQLSWQPGVGGTTSGYLLQVGSAPGRQDLMLIPLGPTTALSGTVADGRYALRLMATNACGNSDLGAEADLVVGGASSGSAAVDSGPVALPGAPESLSATVVDGTVTLTWGPPASGGHTTRYLIEATTDGGPVGVDTGHAGTVFTHPNTPAGTYVVRVRAANAAGAGPASAAVTVVVP